MRRLCAASCPQVCGYNTMPGSDKGTAGTEEKIEQLQEEGGNGQSLSCVPRSPCLPRPARRSHEKAYTRRIRRADTSSRSSEF